MIPTNWIEGRRRARRRADAAERFQRSDRPKVKCCKMDRTWKERWRCYLSRTWPALFPIFSFFSIFREPAAGRKRSRCNSWAHPSEDFSFFVCFLPGGTASTAGKKKNRKATEAPPLASSGHSQVVGWETTPASRCVSILVGRPHVVKCEEMKADRNSRIRQAELANDARQVFPFSSALLLRSHRLQHSNFPHFSVRPAAPL